MTSQYIYDPTVSRQLDTELRELLTSCFDDDRFSYQRFFYELPAHRWILRDPAGRLVAHVAVHDKRLGTEAGELRVAGIAEVCVHPDMRGQGCMRCLMEDAHAWSREQGMDFSTLFGMTEIYQKYGYAPALNPLHLFDVDSGRWQQTSSSYFQVLALTDQKWPQGIVELFGPKY